MVYDELHRLAHYYLTREQADHSLQTTALVNEAYMRLVDYQRMQWQNRLISWRQRPRPCAASSSTTR